MNKTAHYSINALRKLISTGGKKVYRIHFKFSTGEAFRETKYVNLGIYCNQS